jgi:hypothetical protein
MDYLTFASNIVSSLAWPVAAVTLAVIFRESLEKIFERLKTAELPGVKAEFVTAKLIEAEKQAEKADLPPAPPQAAIEDDRPPSSRIFEAWRILEQSLNELFIKHKGSHPLTYSQLREFLYELAGDGRLPPQSIAIFNDLRAIRNRAVHPKADAPDVSSSQAKEFAGLASRLVELLKLIDKSSDNSSD